MIQAFSQAAVKLQNPYFQNAFQKEVDYLKAYDPDKLLAYFRQTNGLQPKAENYGGWEDTEIRGHTLGHYLTATANAYASTGDQFLLDRLQYMLSELDASQLASGYLSAFPEEFFDRVENRIPVWVPWYTMHKIIAGLISVYQLAGLDLALKIVSKLGDWVYARTSKWSPQLQADVLSVEYGGMNDCLYELYKLTKDEKHAKAAHQFDELSLFEPVHDGQDVLNNRHANTTIPKFLGALNRYFVYGDEAAFYLEACKQFWDMVVHHHSYITGGNSESEHFGLPDILDAERSETTCETCNSYNMLKLTRGLYQITGDKKYADFYEQTFYNAILSSQNPETGMTMYFQPMATGFFKVYSKPFDYFWCCTGTGMENFSKLNDSLYFHDQDSLYVNLYVASEVNWTDKQVSIKQETDVPSNADALFTISTTQAQELSLYFRMPDWSNELKIEINGSPVSYTVDQGYIKIKRTWQDQDQVKLTFSLAVQLHSLKDNPNAVAFSYGPYALSAGLGREDMTESNQGIMVKIPTKRIDIKDYIVIKNQNFDNWKKNIKQNLVKQDDRLAFVLHGTDEDDHLVFTPHYAQHQERYGLYWTLVEENSPELASYIEKKQYAEALQKAEIDSIHVGNDQYELSHKINGHLTEAGDRDGHHYRYAKENGWFSYEMKVSQTQATYLHLSFVFARCKKGFSIYVDDHLLAEENRDDRAFLELIEKQYLLPDDVTSGKQIVTVKIKAKEDDITARIVDLIRTTTKV